MVNPTNILAYKRHQYSGPRKSRKKVQATLKRIHGNTSDKFYRLDVWRNKKQKELKQTTSCPIKDSPHATQEHHQLFNLSTAQDRPKIKTYSRAKPKISFEATATSSSCDVVESVLKTEQEESSDIDWPQPDSETEATACRSSCDVVESVLKTEQEEATDIDWIQSDSDTEADPLADPLAVEKTSSDGLSGLTGYRYVDLKHVIQWAFEMERHSQSCQSSQIEYVSEQQKGLHSVITFRCSMCYETWQQSTGKEQ